MIREAVTKGLTVLPHCRIHKIWMTAIYPRLLKRPYERRSYTSLLKPPLWP